MNEGQFSAETLQFLGQFGPDLDSAIVAAPDADLQQVSERYRVARMMHDESAVKRMMLSEASQQDMPADPQPNSQRPPSAREQALMQMTQFATIPEVREMLEQELLREQATQELNVLIMAADAIGDTELATRLGAMLAELMGVSEQPESGDTAQARAIETTEEHDDVPGPNAEPLGADPEAESQAPASEAGDAGVAPGQDGAEPPLSPAAAAVLADKLKSAWGAKGRGQTAVVSNDDDYDALPSGTEFEDPEGNIRKKP